MVKGRPLLRWAGILLACASISFLCIEAQSETEPAKAPESKRPDLIKINTLAAFGELELPAVTFFHDKHTDVLLKEKKNCETCHFVENHKLSLAYKRQKTTKPAEIKDIYHANCIGCHDEMAAAGKKTGPQDGFCRSCHDAKPQVVSAKVDLGPDKVLHFRHVDSKDIASDPAGQGNCGSCHHEYDQQTKKTFYAKGKEDSCRSCHGAKPQNGVMSLEQAAHQQCVLCHLDLANKGVKQNGPYLCAGCHSVKGLALVAKKNQEMVAKLPNKEVPRLQRGQPDAALIAYNAKVEISKGEKPVLMNPVAFDHKAHEKYNDSCRACHHAGIESCDTCHTLAGSKKGKFVTYEQAMHLKTSQQSCTGCHAAKQAAANCAGCHKQMDKSQRPNDATCKQCHMQLPEGIEALRASLLSNPQQKSSIAEVMLKNRKMHPGAYAEGDIPDKVVIKTLSDKYEPVELNHRAHVASLMKGMQGNPLAEYFHRDPGTICQGCHHNSPPDKQPPNCSSCHGKHFGAKESNRPELLAAHHGQCISCHTDMKVEKPVATACIECHKEKQQ
ncbi:MAG: sulfate respiration complex hexadecaheme cytochrome HmcA [Desulfobaccales bacterium]